MALTMTRPTLHPRTGIYRVRKAVPPPLRPLVGKRELVVNLKTRDPAEARRLAPAALARIDAQLAAALGAARAASTNGPRTLTPKEVAAVAGEWRRRAVADVERDPGDFDRWDVETDLLDQRIAYLPGADDAPANMLAAFKYVLPNPRDIDEADMFLRDRGILADRASVERVAVAILGAKTEVASIGLRRASGDWSADTEGDRYPPPSDIPTVAPPVPADAPPQGGAGLTLNVLHDAFAQENFATPKTKAKRTRALGVLAAAAGHDDPARITKADVAAFKARRMEGGAVAKTIAVDIQVLRPIWTWAMDNGVLPEGKNPFARMAPKLDKRAPKPRVPFDDDEAARILRAARLEAGFLRWGVWLLAFTGARLEEVCGATREDVRQERGAWCLDVRPDGATGRALKNAGSQRLVPLHPALVDEGFLAYRDALPTGSPLFPDLPPGRHGRRSEAASPKLGRWLRKAAQITDPRKVGAHSWRHRMEDALRRARVPREAQDAIMGHANPTNAGAGYGDGWRGWPDELAKEIAKIPSPLLGVLSPG